MTRRDPRATRLVNANPNRPPTLNEDSATLALACHDLLRDAGYYRLKRHLRRRLRAFDTIIREPHR